jgi:hypothetical protein
MAGIFVSIAAYRDPELVPTITDCLAKARHPDQLQFGVCWQHGPEEPRPELGDDDRFQFIDVDWRESRGACWARAEIMRLWDGQDYYFQIDSHMRFAHDWDVTLLRQAELSGSEKPVMTSYCPAFVPGNGPLSGGPMRIDFVRFHADAIPAFIPGHIEDWQDYNRPLRARFLSAGFCFAPGVFVEEVPYDPEVYFLGEEISLAVRAFTNGYDLYHPTEPIVWHEYGRGARIKHWDDHTLANGLAPEWWELDAQSRAKVSSFLTTPFVGRYGCGTDRTFQEYEAYAGLSFADGRAQDYTRAHLEPPNPPMPPDWATHVQIWNTRISIDRRRLPTPTTSDIDFWYVGFHDATGSEIYRRDAPTEELEEIERDADGLLELVRHFESTREPVTWTVWPHSRSIGWLDKVSGALCSDGAGLLP